MYVCMRCSGGAEAGAVGKRRVGDTLHKAACQSFHVQHSRIQAVGHIFIGRLRFSP